MNENTVMYQITETSEFMMSFVIITKENNAIIIDGGAPEDMPLLKQYIGGRHVSAWILTHAHLDHIGGFISEAGRNGLADFNPSRVYFNFPPLSLAEEGQVIDREATRRDFSESIPAFLEIYPTLQGRKTILHQGDRLQFDEVTIDVLFTWRKELLNNPMNDSSTVFRLSTPNKSVLFLGDLGPEGGDILFRESRHLLKSDMVQMAHHGQAGVGLEVYAAIMPEACIWCSNEKIFENGEAFWGPMETEELRRRGWIRMYGTALTRQWMDILGVKTHYVSKDGTNKIVL